MMVLLQQAAVAPRPDVGVLPFADVVRMAKLLARTDVGQARAVLAAGAVSHPSIAIREWAGYQALPGATEALREAVLLVPDEAIGLLRAGSVFPDAVVEGIAAIAADSSLDAVAAARAAVLVVAGMPRTDAVLASANGAAYFKALVSRKGPLVSRAIREFSVERMREVNVAGWGPFRALELMMLLANGRGEETGPQFRRAFDMFLAPKGSEFADAAMRMPLRDYRIFVREAQKHGRLEAFLRKRATLFDRALEDVVTLEDSVEAAGIIEGSSDPQRLRSRLPTHIVAGYEKNLESASRLVIADICPAGVCAQRYLFYNDADGVTSYAGFRASYAGDKAWKVVEHDGWVQLSSGRVEIFANVPFDVWNTRVVDKDGETERRQQAVSEALAQRGVEPAVLVHRGHAYHVPKTLRYVTANVKLVHLGSCRGDIEVGQVLDRAPEAQIISTTAVGTSRVNDPLLRELNRWILSGAVAVDWDQIWKKLRTRFGGGSAFQQYIAPNRNSTVAVLKAFRSYGTNKR